MTKIKMTPKQYKNPPCNKCGKELKISGGETGPTYYYYCVCGKKGKNKSMPNPIKEILKEHYSKLGKLGRKAVNSKYTPAELKKKLSEWGKKGGKKRAVHKSGN